MIHEALVQAQIAYQYYAEKYPDRNYTVVRANKQFNQYASIDVDLLKKVITNVLTEQKKMLGIKKKKASDSISKFPEYNDFCRIWDENFHEIGFQMPKDGAKIKSIIKQTRQYISNVGKEPSFENVV